MHWALPVLFALPKITFSPVDPPVRELRVFVDDRPVPLDDLFRNFSVPSGTHHVRAEGVIDRDVYELDEDIDVPDDDDVHTVHLQLKKNPYYTGPWPTRCMIDAKTEAELLECVHMKTDEPKSGCRSCAVAEGTDTRSDGGWLLLVAITIAGSRASSFGSRPPRGRADGRSRTRAARRPRS